MLHDLCECVRLVHSTSRTVDRRSAYQLATRLPLSLVDKLLPHFKRTDRRPPAPLSSPKFSLTKPRRYAFTSPLSPSAPHHAPIHERAEHLHWRFTTPTERLLKHSEMAGDLLCTELSSLPAVSSQIPEDQRRLQILLDQEDQFMPSYHRQHDAGRLAAAEDDDRTRMLEIMHQVYTVTMAHGSLSSYVCCVYNVYRERNEYGSCVRCCLVFRRVLLYCAAYLEWFYYNWPAVEV